MSLRDQLLKAGVVNKKQARNASKQAKKRNHEQLKAAKKGEEVGDDLAKEIAQQQAEQRERDKERNLAIQKQREEEAEVFRIRDLMLAHDLLDRYGSEKYYFKTTANEIHSVMVHERQIQLLAKGALGIVAGDMIHREYILLDEIYCHEIAKLKSSLVVCLHPASDEFADA